MLRHLPHAVALALFAAMVTLAPTSTDAGELPTPQGKIIYSCGFDFVLDICSMNQDGTGEVQLTEDGANDHSPELSPSGNMIAWTKFDTELWVMGVDGSNQHLLRNFGSFVFDPTWSPDGEQVAFACTDQGQQGICSANSDGSSGQEFLGASSGARQPDWSPDGTKILFEGPAGTQGNTDIFVLDVASGQPTNLTGTLPAEHGPRWSPDGTKIAFWSLTGTAVNGWFTMDADGGNRQPLFEPMFFAHPSGPAWSPDGQSVAVVCDELITPDREMCIVDPDDGDLIDVVEVSMGHVSEGWTEPHWGTTGGTQQGDIDCNGSADPIDALKLLRYDAGLGATHNDPCLDIGDEVTLNQMLLSWGDVDCDGVITPVDALKVLRYDASLQVQQEPGCPEMGEFVT
jgi:Tol biopolymer transport system component